MMVRFNKLFCACVGINMYRDAPDFVQDFLDFGGDSPFIMEFDYSGYDVSNPVQIGQAAATIVSRVLKERGYNSSAMKVVDGLLSDLLYPIIELNGDLFSKAGFQPSGKYATAEDNSLRGVLMLMYSWYSSEKTRNFDFFENVLPRVYGDDALVVVKSYFSDCFNNFTYKESCADLYHMKITPAAKSNEFTTFVTIKEMSFLRRNFAMKDGTYVAPLNLNSLYKMMEWYLPSSSVTEIDQMNSTCCSFLWEAYFHLSENQHDTLRTLLQLRLEQEFGVSFELPTWEEMRKRLCCELVTGEFQAAETA